MELTARHGDGSRRAVAVIGQGARLAAALLRDGKPNGGLDLERLVGLSGANVGPAAAAAAAEVAAAGGVGSFSGGSAAVAAAGSGWKHTLPLHLLLNCSALEDAQPRVCAHALDHLVKATMAPTALADPPKGPTSLPGGILCGGGGGPGGGGGQAAGAAGAATGSDGSMARYLAYSCLANLGRNNKCRAIVRSGGTPFKPRRTKHTHPAQDATR